MPNDSLHYLCPFQRSTNSLVLMCTCLYISVWSVRKKVKLVLSRLKGICDPLFLNHCCCLTAAAAANTTTSCCCWVSTTVYLNCFVVVDGDVVVVVVVVVVVAAVVVVVSIDITVIALVLSILFVLFLLLHFYHQSYKTALKQWRLWFSCLPPFWSIIYVTCYSW